MLPHLLAAFTLATAPPAGMCSLVPQPLITKDVGAREERAWQVPSLEARLWNRRVRRPVVYFVAEPTPDTAFAGAYTQPDVPPEQVRPRLIYGQVVRVRRIAGAGAPALERALARDPHRRAVVISHDLGAACNDIPRSGRWLPSRPRPGFFVARIRHPEQWAEGLPTFEVPAASEYPYPYGGSFFYQYARAHPRWDVPILSPDEYFDLYRALPGWSDVATNPRAAFHPVSAWQARNPHLARAFPAWRMLEEAKLTVQVCEGTLSAEQGRTLGIRCPQPDW